MVDAAFGNWLAGFIDGEGCFGIHPMRRGGVVCWAVRFTLKLRDDDRSILEECRARVGAGTIRTSPVRDGRPQCAWVIESRGDCLALAEVLDRFPLRAKKARDYAIWRGALAEWANGERGHRWSGQRDWSRMAALRERLDAVRAYDP